MSAREDSWRTENLDALCRAVLTLETVEEVGRFLRDLCTRKELDDLSARWAVAALLDSGLPYREVSQRTGVSVTTVGRVNEWRRHGTGGYRLVLERTGGTSDE